MGGSMRTLPIGQTTHASGHGAQAGHLVGRRQPHCMAKERRPAWHQQGRTTAGAETAHAPAAHPAAC